MGPLTTALEAGEKRISAHLDRFSPQNHETLRPLHHEPRELVTQNPLNLIRLLDLDADPDGVYRGLNKHSFIFVPGDYKRVKEDFFRCPVGGPGSENVSSGYHR